MRALYEQVLSEPRNAPVWRRLAEGFAQDGRAGRAVACLDALEVAEASPHPRPREARSARCTAGDQELRSRATREAVERRRDLFASLVTPDETRVSVVVVGELGSGATARTLDSIQGQSLAADGAEHLDVHVVSDPTEGLRRANGRYVAHLEAGDELWPDHLAVLADHLDRTGRAMTFSRALRPGFGRLRATDGAPVLPRQATGSEFAPCASVLHRRRALLEVGGFEPHLGRGQAWHLWNRFVDRLRADAVPVLSARIASDDASPERRFDLLLVKLGSQARARRYHGKARLHLARGDIGLAAQDLGRAWNLGLDVGAYVPAIASVAEHSRKLAADLVGLGGGEVEPHLCGVFRRIARGAEARRTMALRSHRHALRTLYHDAEVRGRERARRFGWKEEATA